MANEQGAPRLADLVTILYQPRQTIRRILDTSADRWALQIMVLAAVCAAVSDSDYRELQNVLPGMTQLSTIAIAALGLFVTALMWIVMLLFVSWLVALVGRFLGGTGTVADVRAALAWAAVPVIWSVIYRIPLAVFKSRFNVAPNTDAKKVLLDLIAQGGCAIAVVVLILQFLILIWSLYIASNTIGEAQRFSSWKGLGNLMLAIVLPIVLIAGAIITLHK